MKLSGFLVIIFLITVFPLAAQDNAEGDYDDEDYFDDDFLLMEGEGLTIVGTVNTTQQMETIDRETIEKSHAPDLPSLLEEIAGLGVTRYGPYGNRADVNMRGFNTKRVAVLVDGIPVNSSASGEFDFYSIDPLSIERIEVIQGGSDTKYNVSGALGGVINIITLKKNKPGWSFGGSLSNTSYLPGYYNSQSGKAENPRWQDLADSQSINLSGSYGAKNYSFNLGFFGNRAGNHFLYSDYFDYTRRKEGNEILDGGVSASFVRELGDYSKIITSASFYYGDKNNPVSGYSSNYVEQKDLSSRENLMLDMPRAFHDDLGMELSLGHSWKQIDFRRGNAPSMQDEHSVSLINRWGWYPASALTLRFGADYRFINLDSATSGIHNSHRGGLYLGAEYNPVKQLLLISSVKGMSNGGEIIPVPKIGLAWAINDSITLKNNYYRSFKFPDFDDLYWTESGFSGNPDLKSEDGWGADLAAVFSFKNMQFDSTVYGAWTEDSIHWSNVSGTWRPENSGVAAFLGFENKMKLTLPFLMEPFGPPVANLSWAFQPSWLLSGDTAFKDNKRIPYMPMHTFGASIELGWGRSKHDTGSLVVSGRFESARFSNTANTVELPSNFLLNIIFNQKLNSNINVFAKVNNVLNTSYVSFAEYPMPGINLILGLNMLFQGL